MSILARKGEAIVKGGLYGGLGDFRPHFEFDGKPHWLMYRSPRFSNRYMEKWGDPKFSNHQRVFNGKMKLRNSFWFGDYWTKPTWVLPVSRSGTSNLQHRDVGGFPGWITARTLLASVFCPPSWAEEWVARLFNSAAARKQGCVLWWNLFLPLPMGFSHLWHFKQESLTKVFPAWVTRQAH